MSFFVKWAVISALGKHGDEKPGLVDDNTGGRMRYIILGACLLVTACQEQPQQVRTEIKEDGTKVEYVDRPASGGGMMEHMAGAAVAGAAAGTAGAVAHRATDHLINKHQERKARKQTRPRTYNHRRR